MLPKQYAPSGKMQRKPEKSKKSKASGPMQVITITANGEALVYKLFDKLRLIMQNPKVPGVLKVKGLGIKLKYAQIWQFEQMPVMLEGLPIQDAHGGMSGPMSIQVTLTYTPQ